MPRILLLAVLSLAGTAFAQERETQRALLQRDQQSAEFALQLRQSQEGVRPSPGDNRHLNERQRLDSLHVQQLQSVLKETAQELRPYERQRAADERLLLFAPPVARTQPPEKSRPLLAPLPEAVSPIGPAY